MTEHHTRAKEPSRTVRIVALVWVLAVSAAFCAAFGSSLRQYAARAAERFPFLNGLLDLF